MQTDEIRRLLRNRYAEKNLFTVIRNYTSGTNNPTTDILVRSVSKINNSLSKGC